MFVKETKLKKWGNSQRIRIGKEELKELGFLDEDVVFTMTVDNGQWTNYFNSKKELS